MEQESDRKASAEASGDATRDAFVVPAAAVNESASGAHEDATAAPTATAATLETPAKAEERRRAARRLRRAQYLYLVGLAAFTALASFAYFYAYFGWDLRAARAVQSLSAPWVAELMRVASVPGNGWIPYLLTAAAMLLFLLFRRRSEAAGIVLSAAGGGLLNALLKWLIHRPRPAADLVSVFSVQRSLSFPSGHVMFYVCYFGFLFFVVYALLPRASHVRRLALLCAAFPVALIGFSRVYLGAHWPSDTLGAYLIGSIWLAFSLDMYRRWKQRATFKKLSSEATAEG